jgi:hypothetical protein
MSKLKTKVVCSRCGKPIVRAKALGGDYRFWAHVEPGGHVAEHKR